MKEPLRHPDQFEDPNTASVPVEGTGIRHIKSKTDAGSPKIRNFDQKLGGGRHEDQWNRTPNVNGTGAIHVKSFHCKFADESLHFIDQQINEWLDAHPQYEVKFVTTAVGEWIGKTREQNMIIQVWV